MQVTRISSQIMNASNYGNQNVDKTQVQKSHPAFGTYIKYEKSAKEFLRDMVTDTRREGAITIIKAIRKHNLNPNNHLHSDAAVKFNIENLDGDYFCSLRSQKNLGTPPSFIISDSKMIEYINDPTGLIEVLGKKIALMEKFGLV